MTAPRVDLHIEALALRGLDGFDHRHIVAAIRSELARRIAEDGLGGTLAAGRDVARIDGGQFEVPAGGGAEAVGARIAGAVFRAIRE